MKKKIQTLIEHLLGGKKYYLNIVNDNFQDYVNSTPFKTKKEAKVHRDSLNGNRSVRYIETISFRTRYPIDVLPKQINR